ncbi:hypothetical protein [Mesomycoplasma ovipneumoniae]|uniref:hypothetical protein n=1 Tax=Mesomycoplasma ovipneumoniae TaxID=29562 RepID=UPI00308034C9
MWISLIFSFLILILQISAKSKFGTLEKDKTLAKKPFETKSLEAKINQIIQKNSNS